MMSVLVKSNAAFLCIGLWLLMQIHSSIAFQSVLQKKHYLSSLRMHREERVVVTGLGIISPSGNSVNTFYDNVFNGKSAVSKVDRFDPERFKCQIAAQIRDFNPKEHFVSKKRIKQNDLSCHYAVAASHLALQDANLKMEKVAANRVGVVVGSAFGGMDSFERAANLLTEKGTGAIDPFTVPMILGNTPAGVVAMETGAKGPNFGVQTACATATHALGEV